jgi:FkbM family methyltransferase
MTVANFLVHGVVRSAPLRKLYRACRETPVVGAVVCACARAALPSRNPTWTQLPAGLGEGLWLYCDPVYEEPYAKGDHELQTQAQLKARLGPGDCYYDLGAHTGFLSVIAGRIVGEDGLVLAVEADPENAALLRANAERNRMAQIQVLEAAAWSHSGKLTFRRPRPFTRMEGHVVPEASQDDQSITIPAVSLDELIFQEGRRAPQVVKIDVEGAEWAVLEGARRTLREVKPALLCDVHNPQEVEKIRALLREFGYSTEERRSPRSRYIDERVHQVWATNML